MSDFTISFTSSCSVTELANSLWLVCVCVCEGGRGEGGSEGGAYVP